jgi:hypothetical protein
MKKVLFLSIFGLFLYLSLAFITSCNDCKGISGVYPKLTSIQAQAKKITGFTVPDQNYPIYFTVDNYVEQANGIRYDSIGIELSHAFDEIVINRPFSFFSQAYACDPAFNYEYIESISVISSEDYNADFPKGTDLMDIMTIRIGYRVQSYYRTELSYEVCFLTFNSPPSANKTHTFTIQYTLTNSRMLQTSLDGITINR